MSTDLNYSAIPLPRGKVLTITIERKRLEISLSGKILFVCSHNSFKYHFDYTEEPIIFIIREVKEK